MKTHTDAILRRCLEVLDDPGRPDDEKLCFCRSLLRLVVARRAAARTERAMDRTVREWAMTIRDGEEWPPESA